jgi:predicted secreted protein
MFTDSRSKKVIFVANCILNQNNKFDGTANYPGAVTEIMEVLKNSDTGIVQMPCPEFICLGLDRGFDGKHEQTLIEENSKIRMLMKREPAYTKMKELVHYTMTQILEYKKHSFTIKGVVGVNRSPTCGVETTSKDNEEISGEGVFIEELSNELKKNSITLDIIGIKAFEPETAISRVKKLIFNN